MLLELSVRDLGVIAELDLTLGPGMTAVTGETGAGKTLVVEAIELLVGGRADAVLVRPGADEARVEGRFEMGASELVLARVLPRTGRSRAYINGRLATAAELAELGRALVDLHGQHAHQSLLGTAAQRSALDRFGGIDLAPLRSVRERLGAVDAALDALGGDERARAREIDLLAFQIAEIDRARLTDPGEEETLEHEEAGLADAVANREAAAAARRELVDDGRALDALGQAIAGITGRVPFSSVEARLRALATEMQDAASDLRRLTEGIADDPERLQAVGDRRRLLADLRRKYGETLPDVMAYAADARSRLCELQDHDERARALEAERSELRAAEAAAAAAVLDGRRRAAPRLSAAVQRHLQRLAMPRARFEVVVGDDPPGDDVAFLLGANPGEPVLPLARTGSGGELSRTMLAARLVLTEAPDTLVFDEVDAGVGGEAALAVGRALASVSTSGQVLVVTHLPQVAAFADAQVAVTKEESQGRTVARAEHLHGQARLIELSRMLSGQPSSETARDHAEELLAAASRERSR